MALARETYNFTGPELFIVTIYPHMLVECLCIPFFSTTNTLVFVEAIENQNIGRFLLVAFCQCNSLFFL